jgi:hypothetical protein
VKKPSETTTINVHQNGDSLNYVGSEVVLKQPVKESPFRLVGVSTADHRSEIYLLDT